jgi:hypothetical protein
MTTTKNEIITKTAPAGDGIDGHSDEVAGKEARRNHLFRGTRLKFGKTAEWETKDGDVIEPESRLILVDIARIVTRWGKDKLPAETVELSPGEKFPDIEAWNDELPRDEWIQGMNGLQGPWQSQQIVYFVDPKTMTSFHWPDGSVGGAIAIREVVDSIKAMRRFRPGAAPVVEMSSKFMNTKFGGRQRPHFIIHSWVTMPGEEPQPAALPAPGGPPKPAAAVQLDAVQLDAVKPVTISEEMNDAIPEWGAK